MSACATGRPLPSNGSTARPLQGALLAAAAAVGSACAAAPSPGDCITRATPTVALANRQGEAELFDGDQIEIFLPPQGGVFTELDVTVAGLAASDLTAFTVTIDAADGPESLAVAYYEASAILMWCSDEQTLQIDNLPVGFSGTPAL